MFAWKIRTLVGQTVECVCYFQCVFTYTQSSSYVLQGKRIMCILYLIFAFIVYIWVVMAEYFDNLEGENICYGHVFPWLENYMYFDHLVVRQCIWRSFGIVTMRRESEPSLSTLHTLLSLEPPQKIHFPWTLNNILFEFCNLTSSYCS